MERIQKFLAHQGVASRRQVDQMLQDGRITVNGKPAKPGCPLYTSDAPDEQDY